MKVSVAILVLGALVLSGTAQAAYKCVSPEGKVSFQDLPCEKNSTSQSLATEPQTASAPPAENADVNGRTDEEEVTVEPESARSDCTSAEAKWTLTLSMLDYLAGEISDASKRAQALEVVAKERRLNRDFNVDRCAEKYLANPTYAKQVACIASSLATRETAACRGMSLPSDAGPFVAPKDGGLWPPK